MRRVLIVEDCADQRATLRILLGLWGFQVEEAGNGLDGLRKCLDFLPDAAVVDIGLPGLNGYELARRVRTALGHGIRLIALTAYGNDEDRERALQAGFSHHLTKPCDPHQLFRLLNAPTQP